MPSQVVQLFSGAGRMEGGADSELILLADSLLDRVTRLHRCDAGLLNLPDEDYEREQDTVHADGMALMRLHPTTMEGLIAKARTVRVQFERLVACDYFQDEAEGGETHEKLAWSVLNDLLSVTGSLGDVPSFRKGIAAC